MMRKSANILIAICFSVMVALLSLQVYWIVNYYKATLKDFEKEVNLAFEDGIKKELNLRCDTIQNIIEKKLLDTNAFLISAKFDKKDKKYIYTVSAKGDEKDKFSSSFSLSDYSKALPKNKSDTSVRKHIAGQLAMLMREEDLETHTIYYRTQKLGLFMDEQTKKYQFDTTRLRPAFNIYLKARNIETPYRFIVKKVDSTNNKSIKKLDYAFVTRAFQTYRFTDDQRYVRAMFKSPSAYILSRMALLLFSSFAMILIVSGCMIILLKRLFWEKRLSTIKNDFISNITHEFKTPISTVSVAIEALNNPIIRNDDDKYNRYLIHAKNEIERLNILVDKVLNIAIYEDGKSPLLREKVFFGDKIMEIIHLHEMKAGKRIAIDYQNRSELNEIHVDSTQFQHAISNIIDNAIKYSGEESLIKVTIKKKEDFLTIQVEDNGIGIAEKDIPAVFEKFYRVSTGNSHPVKGHGLGLNYVKQIMHLHNGWYKIESKLGKGTKITLGWPL
ncbi:HAMP domain-containing histidine kinase [Pedobacter sp. MR2016-19]|uniref:sensor histidine kinase n=1 Tax=Pedobacter sp. MR2016-19 TaxID=2780089 RepID=UPI00187695C3|nr:HAMP domain-containing sensor histidine kinase [Pedobacter sp. MR2016-19]MBE5320525.1 HAMP domain-containing histidine kinase [Pedobacter sp. MR2016-19]